MRKFISLISLIVFLAPSLVLAKAAKTAPGAPSVKSTGESASGGGQVLQNIDPPDNVLN
ncbi:hypothetical protein HYW32_00080 [Candidatus Berkelbacteria bacterium]|nr:hypothetical protein [Candidatus Berkelbacteria bacterium]